MLRGESVHPDNGIIRPHAYGRHNGFQFVASLFLQDQRNFAFKCQQHVADTALREGRGGAASTRLEHRTTREQFPGELACFCLIAARLLESVAPGCEVTVAPISRGLRIGNDCRNSRSDEVFPIFDALRVTLTYHEKY